DERDRAAAAARGARDPGRHQPPALRLAQGDHGGEEEGDRGEDGRRSGPRSRDGGRRGLAPRDRLPVAAAERRRRADDRGRRPDGGEDPGRTAAEGSEGDLMAKTIWVVLQLRQPAGGGEPEVARMSWEAIAAAQQLAALAGDGGKAEAVILGAGVGAAAEKVAKKAL